MGFADGMAWEKENGDVMVESKSEVEDIMDGPEQGENSGGSCDYYKAPINTPTTAEEPYIAECNDIIEALDMTYSEANMFKEIWRTAAARTLGKLKEGHNSIRGAEKIEFFSVRNKILKMAGKR